MNWVWCYAAGTMLILRDAALRMALLLSSAPLLVALLVVLVCGVYVSINRIGRYCESFDAVAFSLAGAIASRFSYSPEPLRRVYVVNLKA